ncbi:MAG: type II toxin-antitoxin system VapC family toxin [Bacteroidota bacterium]
MSLVVVDASVAAKWLFEEEHSEAAARLRAPGFDLHAPDFVQVELVNLVAKNERRGILTHAEAHDAARLVHALPLQSYAWQDLLGPAFELAIETKRSVYDCLYLALADALGGALVTADRKFYDALQATSRAARLLWVEDIPA